MNGKVFHSQLLPVNAGFLGVNSSIYGKPIFTIWMFSTEFDDNLNLVSIHSSKLLQKQNPIFHGIWFHSNLVFQKVDEFSTVLRINTCIMYSSGPISSLSIELHITKDGEICATFCDLGNY